MNVAASASARLGILSCLFAGNGPRLAIAGRGREGGALGCAYGLPDVFYDQLRDE